jgi:sulfur-oxidizing protein SoxZ
MSNVKPRVKLPKTAAAGETFVIKTLVSHPMESGQRKDSKGEVIPRKIINKFTCEFNGATVFSCDLDPAISANPYLEFMAKVPESGTFKFTWVDDDGSTIVTEEQITVQ